MQIHLRIWYRIGQQSFEVPTRNNIKIILERHYFNVGTKEDPAIKSKNMQGLFKEIHRITKRDKNKLHYI